MFASSIKRRITCRRFRVVVVQWTSTKCTKKRDARAELLFCLLNQLFLALSLSSRLLTLPTIRSHEYVSWLWRISPEDWSQSETAKYFEWIIMYIVCWLIDEYGGAQSMSSYLMPSGYEMDMYGDAPDKMTYTEQANKRSHCKRLTR